MKIISLLLTISILVISCLNCEDVTELKTIGKAENLTTSISKNQSHSDADYCSPLCTCNCCGQPLVFNLKSISLKSLKPVASTQKIIAYRKHFTSDFFQSIWQPPKLNKEFIG